MKREHYWLIAGLVLGYLVYHFFVKPKNGGNGNGNQNGLNGDESQYLFTAGSRLYSTDKLSSNQIAGISGGGASGGVYAEINNCGVCRDLGGSCRYGGLGGAFVGCQFSDKYIAKGQAL